MVYLDQGESKHKVTGELQEWDSARLNLRTLTRERFVGQSTAPPLILALKAEGRGHLPNEQNFRDAVPKGGDLLYAAGRSGLLGGCSACCAVLLTSPWGQRHLVLQLLEVLRDICPQPRLSLETVLCQRKLPRPREFIVPRAASLDWKMWENRRGLRGSAWDISQGLTLRASHGGGWGRCEASPRTRSVSGFTTSVAACKFQSISQRPWPKIPEQGHWVLYVYLISSHCTKLQILIFFVVSWVF